MSSGDKASIKVSYVELVPVHPDTVPAGCLFLDSTNDDKATLKTPTGPSEVNAGTSLTDFFTKAAVSGAALTAKRPVSKRADGKVVMADSDDADGQAQIGFSMTTVAGADEAVTLLLNGPNLAGALTGLGFAPGELVYQGEVAGQYVKAADLGAFTGNDDIIRIVGIADCAAGVASSEATDLIAITQVIVFPP